MNEAKLTYKRYIADYKHQLRYVKNVGTKTMLSRMIIQNIQDIVPDKWEIDYSTYDYGITLKPKGNVDIQIDEFEKTIAKLARKFNKEPYVSVQKESLSASFYLYTRYNDKYSNQSICIDITTDNKEKCDFETIEEINTVMKPTGYCKLLSERKFLQFSS
jgi:hypothetical protein